MSALMSLMIDLFLKPQKENKKEGGRMVGLILILMGVGSGIFFLFEALVPLIGYLESGTAISFLLIFTGSLLLFLNRKKVRSSPEVPLPHIQDIFKDIDLEGAFKNNAIKMTLLALGAGVVLSQLINIKNLPNIHKLFK